MKKIKRLYIKNFIAIAAILSISFFVVGVSFTSFSYGLIINDKREAISKTAEEVRKMTAAYTTQWGLGGLEVKMAISGLAHTSEYHIILCDETGLAVSCSDTKMTCSHLWKTLPSAVMDAVAADGEYADITNLAGMLDEQRYAVVLPITSFDRERLTGYVVASGAMTSMAELWRGMLKIFFSANGLVLATAFVVSFVTSKRQTETINEMAAAAHKFARGDFSVRIEDKGRQDEIGQLTDAFNTMADSLERSEKLRSEFIANISHELKTPMTTITGFADGIMDGTIPREKQNDYLNIISSEARRLSRLVRNMLHMSQLQSVDASVIVKNGFDITEVVRIALLSLEGKISSRGLDVEAHLPEEAVMTRGDMDSITQVVFNLIDNAVKFANKDSVIKIDLWKKENKVYIGVENEGETIPESELPMIFDRFHKTDKSRSIDRDGVGLGLYIVKSILDNHNEDIFVTSSDGITRFIFTLTLWKN